MMSAYNIDRFIIFLLSASTIDHQPQATQTGIILRDKSEMAPEKLTFQLLGQPWLLCWGSGRENNTFQSIVQLVFQPPLTSSPLLPQSQARGCCGSPVSHNLRNSWQEQFSGDAVGPRESKGVAFLSRSGA